MSRQPDVSVIVPVLNEQDSLCELTRQVDAAFATLPGVQHEVVFVDDGSTDGTWEAIRDLSQRFPCVRGVRMRRNFGKATALSVGAEVAAGELVVTIDGDLQDDPAEIPRFLAELERGAGLVSGWKKDRHDPLSKRLPSRLFNWVTSRACGLRLNDYNCGFKAGSRTLYRSIPLYGELHRFVPAMAHNLGYKVVEIAVNHRPRTHGQSKFGYERYIRGFLDLITVLMLTRYNRRPGHFFGGLGFVLGLLGSVILLYLTGVWVFTDDPIGTRPLLLFGVLLEVAALQLISVGILAELIVHRTERRPGLELVAERFDGATA